MLRQRSPRPPGATTESSSNRQPLPRTSGQTPSRTGSRIATHSTCEVIAKESRIAWQTGDSPAVPWTAGPAAPPDSPREAGRPTTGGTASDRDEQEAPKRHAARGPPACGAKYGVDSQSCPRVLRRPRQRGRLYRVTEVHLDACARVDDLDRAQRVAGRLQAAADALQPCTSYTEEVEAGVIRKHPDLGPWSNARHAARAAGQAAELGRVATHNVQAIEITKPSFIARVSSGRIVRQH